MVLLGGRTGGIGRNSVEIPLAKNQEGFRASQERLYPLRCYPESIGEDGKE